MDYNQAEKAMEAAEKELLVLMDYPPFSQIDGGDEEEPDWGFPFPTERGEDLAEAIRDVHKTITSERDSLEKQKKTIYDIDPNMLAKAFDDVEKEFEDDLVEARLYKKRFPETRISALMQAWKPKQQK